jgi:hypothetical protein
MMKDKEDLIQFAKRIGVRYALAVVTPGLRQEFGDFEGLPATPLH